MYEMLRQFRTKKRKWVGGGLNFHFKLETEHQCVTYDLMHLDRQRIEIDRFQTYCGNETRSRFYRL